MINALSVDLEDWFCVSNMAGAIQRDDWDDCELRIREGTDIILRLLDKYDVKATFFVLGYIAERAPDVIREIDRKGHELATHGHSHVPLIHLDPSAFQRDLTKAIAAITPLVSQQVLGYRAPSFSVVSSTLWVGDILAANNIRYDSSVFPMGAHPDYGIPDAPLSKYQLNDSVIEFPLSCAVIAGKRIPCSGGGYFRLLPYPLTRRLIRRCNSQNRPVVFYIHPWEFDPGQPRIKLPWFKYFRHYCNLRGTERKFDALLSDFEFTTIRNILEL